MPVYDQCRHCGRPINPPEQGIADGLPCPGCASVGHHDTPAKCGPCLADPGPDVHKAVHKSDQKRHSPSQGKGGSAVTKTAKTNKKIDAVVASMAKSDWFEIEKATTEEISSAADHASHFLRLLLMQLAKRAK